MPMIRRKGRASLSHPRNSYFGPRVLLIAGVTMLALALAGGAHAQEAGEPAVAMPFTGRWADDPQDIVSTVASRAPELLSRYIRIDSTNPPANELEGARFLAGLLQAEGISPRVLESDPGRANVYARLEGSGKRRPILLLSHIDVVPADPEEWSGQPYNGDIRDGVVYGRGALDCKGVGIVELLAMAALKRAGARLDRDVVFLATAEEETGGQLGAGWVVSEHPELVRDVEFVINEGGFIHRGEQMPLIYNINAAEKAPCWFRLHAQGEPGHASRPPQETAVTRLVEALHRLSTWRLPIEVGPIVEGYYEAYSEIDPRNARSYRNLARTLEKDHDFRRAFLSDPGAAALVRDTLTPTVLRGSSKTNVVPASAWAEVDSRLLPGHACDRFLAAVRERIGDSHVRVDPTGVAFPATQSPIGNEFTMAIGRTAMKEATSAVVLPGLLTGFTDSHWFRERGIASYGFVPIDVTAEQRQAIHGPDENVDAAALERGVHRLVDILRELSR